MSNTEIDPSRITNRPIFIVRFWWEPGAGLPEGTPGEWRGTVEILLSGKQHFFRSLTGLTEIIADQLQKFPTQPDE